jgi:hypothetical protein
MARRVLVAKLGRDLRPGEVTRHLCGNALCRNEQHLTVGTQGDNNRDTVQHGTHLAGKLTPQVRWEVGARYLFGGTTQERLAAEYGISQVRVSQCARRLQCKF